jgi:glycosyltransferase involved in cell wall biosynthesis
VPVEANAAGKPVVAFAAGGALETLADGETAVMFEEPTVDSLLEALDRLEALDTAPEAIAASAARFSSEAFRVNLKAAVKRARDDASAAQDKSSRETGRAATDEPAPSHRSDGVVGERPAPEHYPRVLMLGKGWFPEQVGGLDRYFRDLIERLPEARGVVVGPAPGAPPNLVAAGRHDMPLPRRLYLFWRATQRLADQVDIVDAHFALYALGPLLVGKLRSKPLVVHFQGPWADENVAAGDGSRWRLLARRKLERLVYRRADAVVVLSSLPRLAVEGPRRAPRCRSRPLQPSLSRGGSRELRPRSQRVRGDLRSAPHTAHGNPCPDGCLGRSAT